MITLWWAFSMLSISARIKYERWHGNDGIRSFIKLQCLQFCVQSRYETNEKKNCEGTCRSHSEINEMPNAGNKSEENNLGSIFWYESSDLWITVLWVDDANGLCKFWFYGGWVIKGLLTWAGLGETYPDYPVTLWIPKHRAGPYIIVHSSFAFSIQLTRDAIKEAIFLSC